MRLLLHLCKLTKCAPEVFVKTSGALSKSKLNFLGNANDVCFIIFNYAQKRRK